MAMPPLAVEPATTLICGDDGDDVIFGGSATNRPCTSAREEDLMFGGKGGSGPGYWLRLGGGGRTPFNVGRQRRWYRHRPYGGAPWEQVFKRGQVGSGGQQEPSVRVCDSGPRHKHPLCPRVPLTVTLQKAERPSL